MTTRTERIEIVKPLSVSWEEWRVLVMTQRTVIGQLKLAAVDCLVACDVAGAVAVKAAVAPEAKAQSPEGLAYQAIKKELEKIRGAKWSEAQLNALNFSSSTLAFVGKHAASDMAAWKKAQYRKRGKGQGKKGRATYGRPQPIHLPKASWDLEEDERGFVLKLHLLSSLWVRVALHPRGGRDALTGIAAKTHERHDCKIVYDERRKKFYALIGFTSPDAAPVTVDPKRVLVVHRGLRHAITAVASNGARPFYLNGDKFATQREALRGRMRASRRICLAELGDGAKGHGKARRSQHLEALEGKLARVTHTWCQQAAAWVAQQARASGCGLILIEDYGGIQPDDERAKRILDHGPLYEQKQAILNAADREGLHVEEVPASYISTTCPACLHADLRSLNRRTGRFHCVACQFTRDADFVAALNMLRTSSADWSHWERRLKPRKKVSAP